RRVSVPVTALRASSKPLLGSLTSGKRPHERTTWRLGVAWGKERLSRRLAPILPSPSHPAPILLAHPSSRRTSVNDMVRQFLKDMVSQESRRHAALERIQPLLDRPSVHLGGLRRSGSDRNLHLPKTP